MVEKYNSEVQEKLDVIHGYFIVQELVTEETYNLHGNMSIALIPMQDLISLVRVRKALGRTMYVNTWCFPEMKRFDGRGYRDLLEGTGSLGSTHRKAKGFDYVVVGMRAWKVRRFIMQNQHLFPHIKRLEAGVRWVHQDSKFTGKNEIVLFNA